MWRCDDLRGGGCEAARTDANSSPWASSCACSATCTRPARRKMASRFKPAEEGAAAGTLSKLPNPPLLPPLALARRGALATLVARAAVIGDAAAARVALEARLADVGAADAAGWLTRLTGVPAEAGAARTADAVPAFLVDPAPFFFAALADAVR